MREKGHQTTVENIRHARGKQQRDYSRPHMVPNNIKVDEIVLLKNQKWDGRQSGKFSFEVLVLTQYILSQRRTFAL